MSAPFHSGDPRRRAAIEALCARAGIKAEGCRDAVTFPDEGLLENPKRWLARTAEVLTLVAQAESPRALRAALLEPDGRTARFDLPGVAFGILERWEERLDSRRDEHGRFPHEASVLFRLGVLDLPCVDWIAHAVFGADLPAQGWNFALTFDIDSAGMFTRAALPGTLRRAWQEGGAGLALEAGRRAVAHALRSENDAAAMLDRLGDRLFEEDMRTVFFVQPTRRHRLDDYSLARSPALVRALRRLRTRGHELGLHPGYSTCEADAASLKRQRRVAMQALGGTMRLSRRHYLRTLDPEDLKLEDQAGVRADFTLGFPGRCGFRLGTAYPYRPWDADRGQPSRLVQVPLMAMDVTLRYREGLSPAEATRRVDALMREVARTGGTAVLAWHPHNLDPLFFRGWQETPFAMLAAARRMGATVPSIEELVRA